MKLQKILVSLIAVLSVVGIAQAAPTATILRDVLPETTNTYSLGTSTKVWNSAAIRNLIISGTCTGCGGSGGIATSSQGQYTPGNVYLVINSSTAIAFDSFRYNSSTESLVLSGASALIRGLDSLALAASSSLTLTSNNPGSPFINLGEYTARMGLDTGGGYFQLGFPDGATSTGVYLNSKSGLGRGYVSLDTSLIPDGNVGEGPNFLFPNQSGTFALTTTTVFLTTSTPKLPTIVVAATNGDFSDIQSAVNAANNTTTYPLGTKIYLTGSTYTVTSTIVLKRNGISIEGNWLGTTVQMNATSSGDYNSPGSSLFASDRAIVRIQLKNLYLLNNSSTYSGTALNLSNIGEAHIEDIQTVGWRYGVYMNDTTNITFYNNITNLHSYDNNCVYVSSTNPVNDNTYVNTRCAFNQSGGASTTYGFFLNNGQSNNLYNFNAEPANQANSTGIRLAGVGAFDNNFYGSYIENNATSVQVDASAQRNNFFGGEWCCFSTANFVDNGSDTSVFGVDNNFTGSIFQYPISASSSFTDKSNASRGISFINNTNFAHVNSALATIQLRNGSDTSDALRVTNAGTGASLKLTNGYGIQATGTVATVSVCGSSPTIFGTSMAGKVTTGTNASSTCTVTFPYPFINAPTCTVTSNTTSSINYMTTVTPTTLRISTASSTSFISNQLSYICIGG